MIFQSVNSNIYKIKTENKEYNAYARGKLKNNEITPLVGDNVEIQVTDEEKSEAIIEKVEQKDIGTLKEGDVIKFLTENYYVIHRIYKIEETDEGLLFTTKGDNNNAPDSKKVKPEQIQGKYRCHVKYVGFPSVWLSEALR